MTDEEFLAEYRRLGHAIQSGVALDHARGGQDGAGKHLRTGLNMVMCDTASLAGLLIAKGVITREEYQTAVLAGLEEEKARYEAALGPGVILA